MVRSQKQPEKEQFVIDLQSRLLEIVEDHAAESLTTGARYIPAVIKSYHTGKVLLVRPETGSVKPLRKVRKGQKLPTIRFSALYPVDTKEWLDAVGEKAGGFNRSHCVISLLLDWFGISPFGDVFALNPANVHKDWGAVSAQTSSSNRIKSSYTCQARFMKLLRKAAGPDPEQQYMRRVLACYATGQEHAFRPDQGTFKPLARSRKADGFETETLGFYFGPELVQWVDELGARAGGFNRSHVMTLLFLDWLHINPFTEIRL